MKKTILFTFLSLATIALMAQHGHGGHQGGGSGSCGGGSTGGGNFGGGSGFPTDTIIIATDTIISPMGDTLFFPGDTITIPGGFGGGGNTGGGGSFGGGNSGGSGSGSFGGGNTGGGGNGGFGGGGFGGGNGFPFDSTFVATDTMITPWGDTLWFPGDTITFPGGNGFPHDTINNNTGFNGHHHGHGHHGHHGGGMYNDTVIVVTDTIITPWGDTLAFPGDTLALPFGGHHGGGGMCSDTVIIATDTIITPWGDTIAFPGDTLAMPFGGHHHHPGHHAHHHHNDSLNCPNDTTGTGVGNTIMPNGPTASVIEDISVYPNPVINQINIEYLTESSANATVRIYAFNGKEVYTQNLTIDQGRNTITCNVSHLPQGIYILTLSNSVTTKQMKFIK